MKPKYKGGDLVYRLYIDKSGNTQKGPVDKIYGVKYDEYGEDYYYRIIKKGPCNVSEHYLVPAELEENQKTLKKELGIK